MIENPYKILGVVDGSDKDTCRKAWRKLCVKYHPDNGGDEAMFDKINKAWNSIESGAYKLRQRHFLRHESLFRFSVC